jgi:glycosyltransferase involved in cell wall biosynthesis
MTAVCDELAQLPGLLAGVESQTLPPLVWTVVDDGSRDGSAEWMQRAAATRSWIDFCAAPERSSTYLANMGRIKRWGVSRALKLTRAAGHDVDFAGILDADVRLQPEHYAVIASAFTEDPQLGVASSMLHCLDDEAPEPWQRLDWPAGPTQTYRIRCLEDIGEVPPYPSMDSISNVKASLRGWRCAVLPGLVAYTVRRTSSRHGERTGYARMGQRTWFLGLHPLGVAIRAVGYSIHAPHTKGLFFLYGWLSNAWHRNPRCPDPEVRAYYRHQRVREILLAVVDRVRTLVSDRRRTGAGGTRAIERSAPPALPANDRRNH